MRTRAVFALGVVVLLCSGWDDVVPEAPTPRARFDGLGTTDTAGRAARVLAQRTAWIPNRRAGHSHERWETHAERVWTIRSSRECTGDLGARSVPFRAQHFTPTAVPTPVQIRGAVDGLELTKTRPVPLIVACELAARLPALSSILRRHGVRKVDVMSAYRIDPPTSFHAFGLALDLETFHLDDGRVLSVEHAFETTPDLATCESGPRASRDAETLRSIACDLAEARVFNTVLTPNYGAGHFDHFHIDVRPDDPRFYVR
jgi:hypothetical protein